MALWLYSSSSTATGGCGVRAAAVGAALPVPEDAACGLTGLRCRWRICSSTSMSGRPLSTSRIREMVASPEVGESEESQSGSGSA
eukprot:9361171-Alexandrium_andersonii.AAC.1